MEERLTARGEHLIVAFSSNRRPCHFCLLPLERPQMAVMVVPKRGNQLQIETFGSEAGVLMHLDCLMVAAVQKNTHWCSRRATAPPQGPPALVLNRSGNDGLAFEAFGAFNFALIGEYRKGCMWCGGHGHAPGVVLNFPVPDCAQRFRLLHIACIEEMYALQQPAEWLDRPAPDPEPLLKALAELLSVS